RGGSSGPRAAPAPAPRAEPPRAHRARRSGARRGGRRPRGCSRVSGLPSEAEVDEGRHALAWDSGADEQDYKRERTGERVRVEALEAQPQRLEWLRREELEADHRDRERDRRERPERGRA